MPPQVTTIVPVRNTWPSLLKPCLDSIAAQTVPQCVILVDDASDNPETIETLKEYTANYDWLYIRHRRQRGVATARNSGLKRVRTQYTAICDSDDLWDPQKLEKQLRIIDKVCICGTQIDYRNAAGYPMKMKRMHAPGLFSLQFDDHAALRSGNGTLIVPQYLLMSLSPEADDGFSTVPLRTTYARLIRFNASLCGSNTLFDTEELRKERFEPKFNGADEWDALLNLAHDFSVQIAPEPLVTYVRHSGGYSTKNLKRLRRVCETIIYKHRLELTDEERIILQSVETAQWAEDFERSGFHPGTPYRIISYGG